MIILLVQATINKDTTLAQLTRIGGFCPIIPVMRTASSVAQNQEHLRSKTETLMLATSSLLFPSRGWSLYDKIVTLKPVELFGWYRDTSRRMCKKLNTKASIYDVLEEN